jgi:UDP-glucose 4-epimerase
VRALRDDGHEIVVVDNLCRGHREAIPKDVELVESDVRDTERLATVLRSKRIEAVMHFAAFAYVGESVDRPIDYYENNVGGTVSLLRAMDASHCRKLVFSSTCATYGEPAALPITEETQQSPVNPYGASKLFCERMIRDYAAREKNFTCGILRYFNVAGAHPSGELGEDHSPETHLIPVALQTALGLREKVVVHGADYPTRDGTCIRDYLHVQDLVSAHVTVMKSLSAGNERVYNLGVGRGYSVNEVLEAVSRVVERPLAIEHGPRRAGDPASLYADASKIERELGWVAKLDLARMVEDAWRWFRLHPTGYGARALR